MFQQSFQRGLFILVQELIYKLYHLPLWTHTHRRINQEALFCECLSKTSPTGRYICDFSYLALLKRLQWRSEWYLPHTACNPGLCWVALMATVLALASQSFQETQCGGATLWSYVILQLDKDRAYIVLQDIMWPDRGIQGFSINYTRTEATRTANSLIYNLDDLMGVMSVS